MPETGHREGRGHPTGVRWGQHPAKPPAPLTLRTGPLPAFTMTDSQEGHEDQKWGQDEGGRRPWERGGAGSPAAASREFGYMAAICQST